MKNIKNYKEKIKYILSKKQIIIAFIICFLSLIGAFLECIGISSILPVIDIITSPDSVTSSSYYKYISFLPINNQNMLIIFVTSLVIIVYVLKNIYQVFLTYIRNRFACNIQREISLKMLTSYMSRGYDYFLTTNQSEIQRGVETDAQGFYTLIDNILKVFSDVIIVLLVLVYLLMVDWQITGVLFITSLICVFVVSSLFKKKMYAYGIKTRDLGAILNQILFNSYHAVKDIIILRKQKFFVDEYSETKNEYNKYIMKRAVLVELPRYIIEVIFIIGMMITICARMIWGGDMKGFISSISLIALGAFRILPYLSRVSSEINTAISSLPSMDAVYMDLRNANEYLALHPEKYALLSHCDKRALNGFEKKLELDHLVFKYSDGINNVIDDVNLVINKGESIAFIGTTGAGKSTLADLILGLHTPNSGHICIDGINITDIPSAWSSIVGYIPQTIALCDDTILKNIAFGEKESDIRIDRINDLLKTVELKSFVDSLPDGVNTEVGDAGVRLSGGQRQRIAIARALYHDPEIIVMDEATSALDNETEKTIMKSIEMLKGKVTLIIIAHRLTTVRGCDRVFEVSNGKLYKRNLKEVLKDELS